METGTRRSLRGIAGILSLAVRWLHLSPLTLAQVLFLQYCPVCTLSPPQVLCCKLKIHLSTLPSLLCLLSPSQWQNRLRASGGRGFCFGNTLQDSCALSTLDSFWPTQHRHLLKPPHTMSFQDKDKGPGLFILYTTKYSSTALILVTANNSAVSVGQAPLKGNFQFSVASHLILTVTLAHIFTSRMYTEYVCQNYLCLANTESLLWSSSVSTGNLRHKN